MAFSAKQLTALRRDLDARQVRTREAHGRELSYLEGWYVISEANRIFGFDGWSRETVESRCVLARESRGNFLAVYVARVRITVNAREVVVIREGHGSGEGRGTNPGETHDIAVKAAETDATKRALATFGKPFGLELYRSGKATPLQKALLSQQHVTGQAEARTGLHPDDTTPIPRTSKYYGRGQSPAVDEHFRGKHHQLPQTPSAPDLAPASPDLYPGRIDKSALMIGEPKRLRDKAHLKFVASQPCLVCGRQPCDPHHLRFAQPRAVGKKVSDEFTVPLCRGHHRQLHQTGDEQKWWKNLSINPLQTARTLWEQSHPKLATFPEKAPR
jgi:hypothetical protein